MRRWWLPSSFGLGLRKHMNRFPLTWFCVSFSDHVWKKVSRYGFPSRHYTLLSFSFPFHFLTQPAISLGQLDFSSTPSLSQSLTSRRLHVPQAQTEGHMKNYWKTTKMWFKILISQKLPHRALAPEMSLSSLLQRHWCVKPGHPTQAVLSEMADLREREPSGDNTFTSDRSVWCHTH